MSRGSKLIIVGNPDPVHVGAHLMNAARSLGLEAQCADSTAAFAGPRWRRAAAWWLQGRRPPQLRAFSRHVVDLARRTRPDVVLATGLAPLDAGALCALGDLGIVRLNFLTDDPWAGGAKTWFTSVIGHYDHVFTPRQANLGDLAAAGARASLLPFAYSPAVHFPTRPTADDSARFDADVVFAGGADRDRVPVAAALIEAGFDVALYGGYWDRDARTRKHARGFLDAAGVRKAIGAGRVSLCLVRASNRDGHSMRTFEVPAMRGCVLAEATADHRELFGPEEESAVYFADAAEAVEKTRRLLAAPALRHSLVERAFALVTGGGHTYADRLRSMLHHVRPRAIANG